MLAGGTSLAGEHAASAPRASAVPRVGATQPVAKRPTYAGSAACRSCHETNYRGWSGSLHALAMRAPDVATKAPFTGETATFSKDGKGTALFKANGKARSVTITEGGAVGQSYDVRYVFGARPVEQYLVSTDKGHLQALPLGYDTAKHEWFDIFSGDERLPGDFGHWLGRGMNANSQCISCHATGYRTGFDATTASYDSTWAEMGVGCESCHGPGAAHVGDPTKPYGPFGKNAGIAAFRPKPAAAPNADPATAAKSGATPPASAALMTDTCATCHSIRREIAADFTPGDLLLDHYEPDLLDEDHYWADGQVHTESYEWGSFSQSRMHGAGVNCLACHDVHTGNLRQEGNALCLSCHQANLAESSHTHHASDSPGSQCVSCHMPESVFMARDHRRDHSLSIPDPISAKQLAIPSACEQCHAGRGREVLAADATKLWPALAGEPFAARRQRIRAFSEARAGTATNSTALRNCLTGATCDSAIMRATAARLTTRTPLDVSTVGALVDGLADKEPLVRSASAFALADADPASDALVNPLLAATTDPVLAVRINAAWALRGVDANKLPQAQGQALTSALEQWRTSVVLQAWAPESWHSLGVFETARGNATEAEADYRKAIAIEPGAVPSRHNLAMLLVSAGRLSDAQIELTALVESDDSFAPAWYALGILYGEQKNWPEAARTLGRCLKLDPDYPGALTDLTHAYLESGVPNVARAVLTGALQYAPVRREALAGLVAVELKSGTPEAAVAAAKALVAEDPTAASDPQIAKLLAGDVAGAAAAAQTPSPPAPVPQTPAPQAP